MKVTYKKEDPTYADFVKRIFFQYKTNELVAHQWPKQMLIPILEAQFASQEISYNAQFPNAERLILMLRDKAIGRLLLDKSEAYHIVNIIIDDEFQGKSIGTAVLKDIIEKAKNEKKQVTLKVHKNNPAFRLYKRLGFEVSGEDQIFYSMKY